MNCLRDTKLTNDSVKDIWRVLVISWLMKAFEQEVEINWKEINFSLSVVTWVLPIESENASTRVEPLLYSVGFKVLKGDPVESDFEVETEESFSSTVQRKLQTLLWRVSKLSPWSLTWALLIFSTQNALEHVTPLRDELTLNDWKTTESERVPLTRLTLHSSICARAR